MRYVFYGMIVLTLVLVVMLVGQVIFWSCRIFVCKHTAWLIHWWTLGTIITVAIVVSVWGHYITRFQINVNHIEVASSRVPATFDGYRIAHISDMHLDCFDSPEGHTFLNRLADNIEQQHPDIIVFTGDIVSMQSREAEPFRQELARIASIAPTYSILGNHDYADYTRMSPREKYADVQKLSSIQREAGWHLLNNESIIITKEQSNEISGLPRAPKEATKEHLILVGVENIGEPPFSTYGDLKKAIGTVSALPTDSDFTILLSHNPTHWRKEVLPDTDIDLMLAGHTHAVQFQIGSWSPAEWKYKEWSGLYRNNDKGHPRYLYVNTGIGGVGPRVRVGVAPELTIIDLRR